jgi:predicted ester cyclase
MNRHDNNKTLLAPLRGAMADFSETGVRKALGNLVAADAAMQMCHPFGDLAGPEAFYDVVLKPLFEAMPDLERRDWIVMAGEDDHAHDWVGCGGHYVGTFTKPFLGIQPTGHIAHMRFHEFYRFEAGKVTGFQAIWDIPELMMQAGAWPMAPSLGREFFVPGPATQDGLLIGPRDTPLSEASKQHVVDMLTAMVRHPREPVAAMQMDRFWHSRMNWYGPAGIGTGRGIAGFRNWHQIPFLTAMPDRGQQSDALVSHFFGDGDYVAVTGWPNMRQTITKGGWLGIAPAGQEVEMRSLDFWRLESLGDDSRRIRENWVLVDLLHLYHQIGVDVLARVEEFNKARLHFVPDQKAFAS